MIADPIRSTRRTKIVALGAAATIGLATLTGASQGSTAVPRRGQDFKSVRVTDFVAAPAWERTLRRKLQQEVVLDLGATSLPNAISWLRRKTEIDFVVHPDIADSTDENFECELPGMPVAKALDVLCDGFGVEYGLRNGAVYVGERGGARALVKRVYDVRELIQSVNGEEDEEPDYWPERLAHLIHAVVGNEGDWDREGVRRDFWRGALIVTQTHEVHRELLAFLNRLLNHGRGPRSGVDAASAELAKQLAARVSVDYQEADIGEIASFLKKHGLPVLMHEDVDPDTTVELHLRDAALRDVIAHVASLAGIRITLHRGFVRIGYEDQPLHVRYYDISKLLTTQGEADEDLEDGLIELVRGSVPGIWDEEGTKIEFWKDLMLVRQSDAGHREVRAFLDALMRALER